MNAHVASWTWPTRLAILTAAVAFCLIVFGAFVRLSHAGLSCPDWPTCYGQVTWPGHEQEIANANAAFPERPVESLKTWREQGHRMLAGTLGLLILALALIGAWPSKSARGGLAVAAISAALGVYSYGQGAVALSVLCSIIALLLPLRLPPASSVRCPGASR